MGNKHLRTELQAYLARAFPGTEMETEPFPAAHIHIRFELGNGLSNGTRERAEQATGRALAIFNDIFSIPDAEIWILVYEFPGENLFGAVNDYLRRQLPGLKSGHLYIKDEETTEKDQFTIIIDKVRTRDLDIRNILNGIANCEMGLSPGIDQRVFFFDPATDRAFMMYDDRGCFVWSNAAEKIRYLYEKYNEWIVDYHRPEIDSFFR